MRKPATMPLAPKKPKSTALPQKAKEKDESESESESESEGMLRSEEAAFEKLEKTQMQWAPSA